MRTTHVPAERPKGHTRLKGSGFPNGIEFIIYCHQTRDKSISQFKFKLINTYSKKAVS
jgi:hypothetical protein